MTHAFGSDKKNGSKQHIRMVYLFLLVLIVGVVICGAATLTMSYHHTASLDGLENPVSPWAHNLINRTHDPLKEYARGSWTGQSYSQPLHLGVGVVLATILLVLCLMIPQWPLHPVGLVMAGTWYIGQAWASIMFGWFIKMAIVRYGGAKAYNIAKHMNLKYEIAVSAMNLAKIYWRKDKYELVISSLKEEIKPRDFVLPDQLFDRTKGRPSTFFGDGIVAHVAFAEPFCNGMRDIIHKGVGELGIKHHFTGTYVWADPKVQTVYVFLSNRVYPRSDNYKISKFDIRTNIQQVIYNAIEE